MIRAPLLALWGVLTIAGPAIAADPERAGPVPRITEIPATPESLARLRGGGYVLFLRHAFTDSSRVDRLPEVDLEDCTTQRPLSPGGRLMAVALGEAIRQAAIPVAEIITSPLCRTRDTAILAFPGHEVHLDREMRDTANLADARKAPILARLRRLLSMPVSATGNRIVVGHGSTLMDLTGYLPRETTLVVFQTRPDGGIDYVASIPPGLWPVLLP